MSHHPLQQRIQALRRRVVRLLAVRGLSAIAAAVLAMVIALGGIDYLLRFRDRGVLVVFAVAVLGVLGWTGYLAVRRLVKTDLGDTELALHVETCFPAVKDRLASAVEFLRQPEDDAAAGSAAMRRAAIAQAVAASADLDFGAALDRRPALRWALAALLVGGLAACLTVADAAAARTALARLAFPLGTADWPQRTHLGLRPPVKTIVIVRGQALEVEVIDSKGAPLPPDCRVHYRLTDAQGRTREEIEPMQLLGKAMVARRENVTSPLEFRCTGGDDGNMNWTQVQVIDPPELPAVRRLTLKITPPAYTNWPEEDREATSTRPLLAGSRVQLAGKATKRLKPSSTLRLDDGRVLPLEIEKDGLTFHVGRASPGASGQAGKPDVLRTFHAGRSSLGELAEPPHGLIVEKSTGYTFHLVDVDGVEGGGDERWQFRVLADAPPSAVIEQPPGDLFVTQRAVVIFRVHARDDLALRQVVFVLAPSDVKATRERTIALFNGPDKPPPESFSAFDAGAMSEPVTKDCTVELSEFQLSPGMQLTCHAAASDYRPQTGRSDPRVLTVITPDQLLERMAVRQSQILAELARVLQLQREARSQVRTLEIRLHEAAGLEQNDIDGLQAAEFNQREVARSLTSRSDGLPMQVLGLLADLENNRVDNPAFQRRLEGLLDEFDRLQRNHLPQIGTELTAAIKGSLLRLQSAPRPAGQDAQGQSHLAAAGQHQQQVITSLEGLLGGMRQWDDYRRFRREWVQLLRDQEEVARSTAALGAETIGRDLKELSPQESSDLKILAEHQLELARRETRLEQEMEQTAAALGQSEPLAAATLTDAVAEARRLAIAADMSAAGGKIHNNALGLAPADQQRILPNVQEVLDILANNRRQELVGLVKKLGEADRDLHALLERQEGLRHKIERITGPTGSKSENQKAELQRLAREQDELRRQTQQLGRRLERLLAEDAANAAGNAADRMDQGRQAGEAGDRQGARRGAQEAEKGLNDAARKLREKRFEFEAQLAMEQQARLQDTVKYLHHQEERIIKETRDFAEMERVGALDRTRISSLLELAHQQELLGGETGRVMQALDPANVFRLALSVAVDEMGRASTLLQRRQTGPTTQQAEQNAADRLKLILAAVEAEEPDTTSSQIGEGDQGREKHDGGPLGGVLPLAQVKLLKLLQENLNLRTQQLNQAEDAGKPVEELREQYARLSEEQGRLAELTFQLLHVKSKAGDDHDSQLPGDPARPDEEMRKRLEKELGPAAQEEDKPKLLQAAEGMREVQQRIGRRDSGPVTQHVQRQVVSDLDKLIEEAKKSGPRGGQSPNIRKPTGNGRSKPAQDAGQSPGASPQPAQESNPKIRKPEEIRAAAEKEAYERMLELFHAELQGHDREQMIEEPSSEDFLPEYKLEIEDYFRRLSQDQPDLGRP